MNCRQPVVLLLILLLTCAPLQAGLDFSGSNSAKVSHGSAASLDDLDPLTFMAWVQPTSLVSGRRFYIKQGSGGGSGTAEFFLSSTGGDVRLSRTRVTTNTDFITNSTPLVTLNKWYFVTAVFDTSAGAGEVVNIYVGDAATATSEETYGTATDGSGALSTDAAGAFFVGNRSTNNRNFTGLIAWAAVWNRALSAAEVEQQRLRPFCEPSNGCVVFTHYGFNGVGTQPDWSGTGNDGTVTNATVADHAPIAFFAPQFLGTPAPAGARRLFIISKGRESKQFLAVQPSCPYGYERAGGRK